MLKKILLGLLTLIVLAVASLFLINGQNNYDATKYSTTATDGINIGSKISFTLPDQFDKAHSLTDDTKKLILVFAKATGHTVKEFLKTKSSDYLSKKNALFIADISPMPTVIRNTFALPDFKKSNYSVLLIYDKEIAKQLKNEANADKIAIATIENGVVKNIKFVTTAKEIVTEL
jgi:uncharacterized protein YxeA